MPSLPGELVGVAQHRGHGGLALESAPSGNAIGFRPIVVVWLKTFQRDCGRPGRECLYLN